MDPDFMNNSVLSCHSIVLRKATTRFDYFATCDELQSVKPWRLICWRCFTRCYLWFADIWTTGNMV